jgi:hypothetical protein
MNHSIRRRRGRGKSQSRHHKKTQGRNKKFQGNKKKGWVTAVDAAERTLKKTGSLKMARSALRLQAYQNARKLFGSSSENM